MYTSLLIHWASIGFQIDWTEEEGAGLGLLVNDNGILSSLVRKTIAIRAGNSRTRIEASKNNMKWESLDDSEEEQRLRRRNLCQEVLELFLLSKSLPPPQLSSGIIFNHEEKRIADEQTLGLNFHDAETVIMSNHQAWETEGNSINDDNHTAETPSYCYLCMAEFGSECRIVKSRCSKFYHRNCMLEWMKNKNDSCPDCEACIWDHIEFGVEHRANGQSDANISKRKKITSDKHLYLSENSNNDKISVASTADTSDPFSACSSYFCENEEDRSPLSRHNNNTSSAIPPPLPCVFFSQKDKVHASALAA